MSEGLWDKLKAGGKHFLSLCVGTALGQAATVTVGVVVGLPALAWGYLTTTTATLPAWGIALIALPWVPALVLLATLPLRWSGLLRNYKTDTFGPIIFRWACKPTKIDGDELTPYCPVCGYEIDPVPSMSEWVGHPHIDQTNTEFACDVCANYFTMRYREDRAFKAVVRTFRKRVEDGDWRHAKQRIKEAKADPRRLGFKPVPMPQPPRAAD